MPIGGKNSTLKTVELGVPEGSILGVVLFNLFVNDMPDACNDYTHCSNSAHLNRSKILAENCKDCGSVTVFADDAIYVNSDRSRERNQTKMETTMNKLKNYLINSRMSINTLKTIIWEFLLKQKFCKIKGSPPSLMTTTDKGDIKEVKT